MAENEPGHLPDRFLGKKILGRYHLQSLLGTGGMSRVYRAFDEQLERSVAAKILFSDLDKGDGGKARFIAEAKLTSKLNHPGIVSVFDFGFVEDERPCIITELIEGKTLAAVLDEIGSFDQATALPLFLQMAEAIAFAHKNGVIHRDIKPGNMMLVSLNGSGAAVVKVLDFGLFRLVETEGRPAQRYTENGDIFGTVLYMSPEQCKGEDIDFRSDIYSFGCVMYECLTGLTPFQGNSKYDLMNQHVNCFVVSPEQTRKNLYLSERVIAMIMRCLAKDVLDRYRSMDDVCSELRLCIKEGANQTEIVAVNSKAVSNVGFSASSVRPISEWIFSTSGAERQEGLPSSKLGLILGGIIFTFIIGIVVLSFVQSEQDKSLMRYNGTTVTVESQNSETEASFVKEIDRATALFDAGDFNLARTVLDNLSKRKLTNVEKLKVLRLLSDISFLKGDIDSSDAFDEQAQKIRVDSAQDTRQKDAGVVFRHDKEHLDRLSKMAKHCHNNGQRQLAISLLERAVAISEQSFGTDSQDTQERLQDLAAFYLALGMDDKAEKVFERLEASKKAK